MLDLDLACQLKFMFKLGQALNLPYLLSNTGFECRVPIGEFFGLVLQSLTLFLDFIKEPHILDHYRCLVGKGDEKLYLSVCEGTNLEPAYERLHRSLYRRRSRGVAKAVLVQNFLAVAAPSGNLWIQPSAGRAHEQVRAEIDRPVITLREIGNFLFRPAI